MLAEQKIRTTKYVPTILRSCWARVCCDLCLCFVWLCLLCLCLLCVSVFLCLCFCVCFAFILCLALVFALCLLVVFSVFVFLCLLVMNLCVSHRLPIVFNKCVCDCVCKTLCHGHGGLCVGWVQCSRNTRERSYK